MGKSTISTGPWSMAMLVYHRVIDDGFKCSKPKQSRWIVDFSIPKRQSWMPIKTKSIVVVSWV